MHVKQLKINHYRGLKNLCLRPQGHVVILGPPGAGKTDVLNALARVLDTEAMAVTATELDFHGRDTGTAIGIEVTLGGLSPGATQNFLDHLEMWDTEKEALVEQASVADELDEKAHEFVVRVAYRALWLAEEERAEERWYFAKNSDVNAGVFATLRRAHLLQLPFSRLRLGSGSILSLSGRGSFRRAVDGAPGGDFAAAVDTYLAQVTAAADQFGQSVQLSEALATVLQPIRMPLRVETEPANEVVKFSPEGGSESGLLRSLSPSVALDAATGFLAATRHGRTAEVLLRIGEALAPVNDIGGVLVIDDLGDGLDTAAGVHVASVVRRRVEQGWITTRVAAAAEVFEPFHLFRIGVAEDGIAKAWRRKRPTTRSERVAARHASASITGALSFRAVAILEGPDDWAALNALARRRFADADVPLPASHGIVLIQSGGGGQGGSSMVAKAGMAAKEMGLFCVGVIDGDTAANAQVITQQVTEACQRAIRLPDGIAIERALVNGVPEEQLRRALAVVVASTDAPPIPNLDTLDEGPLRAAAAAFLKAHGGLHADYVEALARTAFPPLACAILDAIVESALNHEVGLLQL